MNERARISGLIAAALQARANARGISALGFAQEAVVGLPGRTRQPLAA